MMLCCCGSRDNSSSSYSLGDGDKDKSAHIQTGKGPLQSSNQHLASEATLDKEIVAPAQQDSNLVTEQPINPSSAAVANESQPLPKVQKPESPADDVSLDISSIEAQIIKPDSDNSVTENKPVEKPIFMSTVNVKSSSKKEKEIVGDNSCEKFASINSQLASLEQAITEVESKSVGAGKSAVPDLAHQLKVIHTQVQEVSSGCDNKMADKNLQDVVSRLESVATRLESLAVGGGKAASGGGADEVSAFVAAFDDLINGPVAEYCSLSNDIGDVVKEQAEMVKAVFETQKEFLGVASKCNQPTQNTLMVLLKPCASKLQEVTDHREKNRRSAFFNHLSTVSESISAMGWITITPAPGPYVKELADAGTFFKNRITQIVKDKDPKHVAWGKSWAEILKELQAYIKTHHTTGVAWNLQGPPASATSIASRGPPPPPPPPPAAPVPDASSGGAADGKAALFASINQGEGVTKGLKKVSDDMKTHKNPALRTGPAPFKPKTSPKPSSVSSPKPTAAPVKPPKIELLMNKKWVIENFKDDKTLVMDKAELRHTVYIFNCDNCVIQIKGKVNSITVDSCKKTGIVFEDVLSCCEFVNCKSVQGQVTGKIGTLSIDKTDGCSMYLSKDALDVEIVAAKSSEMNISIPQGADGDFKEYALPEQFKTIYNKSKGTMETSATDI